MFAHVCGVWSLSVRRIFSADLLSSPFNVVYEEALGLSPITPIQWKKILIKVKVRPR